MVRAGVTETEVMNGTVAARVGAEWRGRSGEGKAEVREWEWAEGECARATIHSGG